MSTRSPHPAYGTRAGIPDWLRPRLKWTRLPSWLGSAVSHVAVILIAVAISQSKSCQSDISGDDGDSFQQVGLYVKDSTSDVTADPADPTVAEQEQTDSSQSASQDAATQSAPTPDSPPVDISLPEQNSLPVLGAGGPPPVSLGGLDELLQPSPSTSKATTGAVPQGVQGRSTSLFGIADAGKRYVYCIDRSGSMADGNRLRAAKNELMRSLQRLDATQEFQVIFYNMGVYELQPPGSHTRMFRGMETQRLDVATQMDGISPNGGTRHLAPLLAALTYHPDVIYFLTDGAHLEAADVEKVTARNGGEARIHCIEFGEGPETPAGNLLKKLAERNGGKYAYRNVARGF